MSNFKYCQSEIESDGKCEQQCEHCKEYYRPLEEFCSVEEDIEKDKQEKLTTEMYDYFEEENEIVRKQFDLDAVLAFTKEHRVEIIMGSDYQYQCYIDAKPNDGCYATGLSQLGAMVLGIKEYIKHNKTQKS